MIVIVAIATFLPGGGLERAFEARPAVAAEDDSFMVRAGRRQFLDVLANDPVSDVARIDVRILAQPTCGSVALEDEVLVYDSPAGCIGRVQFAYCIAEGAVCEPARVSLTVAHIPDPRPES